MAFVFVCGIAGIGFAVFFSLDIFLFVTKRDFGNVNINVAIFTRHDNKSTTDKIRFKSIDTKVPLRDILRNRFLFWRVIYASLQVSLENPVLNFGSHAHAVLSPIRGRAARPSASAEFKRLAGLPFTETKYQLAVVYDRSEDTQDKRSRILRVMLVRDVDLRKFQQYLDKPPINKRNFELMKRIHRAFKEKAGRFIEVDITAA